VTDVEISKLDNIIKSVPPEEMYAVYLKGEGDVHLGMLIFLEENDAMKLASRLLGVKTMNKLDALGRSSISEVGNILMAGSFLNALSDGTGFQVTGSVPGFAIETFRTVVQYPATDIASTSDIIVTADAVLHAPKSDITVHILIILGTNEAKKLIDSDKSVSK
jgi:chemotaxis protein CheC